MNKRNLFQKIMKHGLVIYGLGRIGRKIFESCKNEIPMANIMLWDENETIIKQTAGLEICCLPDLNYFDKSVVIIICVFSESVMTKIKKQLVNAGFSNIYCYADFSEYFLLCCDKEYFDICKCNECVLLRGGCKEYKKYLQGKEEQILPTSILTATPTLKCSLKCKECIQYSYSLRRKKGTVADKREFLESLDKTINAIGYLMMITLCGGEFFTYPDWQSIVLACIKNKKIGIVNITTNGVCKLKEEDMFLLQNEKVILTLDNYGERKLSDKYNIFKDTKEKLELFHINYSLLDNTNGTWYKLGGFDNRNETDDELRNKYLSCYWNQCYYLHPNCTFSICGRQNISELLGKMKLNNDEIIQINKYDVEQLRLQINNLLKKKCLKICEYCNGTSVPIDAGRQFEE